MSDTNGLSPEPRPNFPSVVRKAFEFLGGFGFEEIESKPTIVRFRSGDVIASIYHGRQSYEVGFEIGRGSEQHSMSALIRSTDPETADLYRNPVAKTSAELESGVGRLADLAKRFGERALRNDASFFETLRNQQTLWSEAYALDVLANQIRPQAEAAFRDGRYREAAKLYEQIHARLSPTELRKLEMAQKRS